ncbi:C-X-C chemokine receptor type 3.1 [Lampris incognitus]|uniref:C-X-C chemokine receptor type 3.1 n=1 Tax=Lampris incognitus TaxID=2546036 RepID=UPI0024B6220D|nr:C-X-C chemokine receptor type 3.1 [Lampris incognitus]
MDRDGVITVNASFFDLYADYYLNSSLNYSDWNNSTRGQACDLGEGIRFEAVFIPALYSLAIAVGLPGNGLLLWVLAQQRKDKSVTDNFILHLGIADTLLLLTLPFWAAEAAQDRGWSFGTPLCKITGAIFTINFYCGIFLLVCISLDRYLSIVHATQMYNRKKPWVVQVTCLTVWVLSLVLSIPDWIFLEEVREERQDKMFCIHVYERFSQSASHWWLVSRLLYHVVGFLLPSAALLYCYSCIMARLLRGSQGLQKQRAVKVILVLVAVFFLCWMPYNITLLLDTVYSNQTSSSHCEVDASLDKALKVTSSLGYLHCSLNPVLYAFVGVKFRHQLLNLLCSVSCRLKMGMGWNMPVHSRRGSIWSESADTSNSTVI